MVYGLRRIEAIQETPLKDCGLNLLQPEDGYRFSVDSLLLVEFTRIPKDAHVLDIGTGSGVIALCIARRYPRSKVLGIEIQEGLFRLAQENVRRNRLETQVEVIHGDIARARELFSAGMFHCIVANPPYREPFSGRLCPNAQEALSRHEILLDLETLVESARYLLRPGGYFTLIYPAERSAVLFYALVGSRLQPKRVRFVHHRPGQDSRLVLVEAIKDARPGLRIMPPLFLNKASRDLSLTGHKKCC